MSWFFCFFIVSGFCSLVYQITWLRVAMAAFGVTSSLVAICLSVFMAGLALGSWGGGLLVSRMQSGTPRSFLRLYAAAELIIGLSGFIVSPFLGVGHDILMRTIGSSWGSNSYYIVSGALIAVALLPFCVCMGATFPIAMAAVRAAHGDKSGTSFSYLYIANVLGAMAGGFCSAFILIELLGFRGTMMVAACLNLLVALLATIISSRAGYVMQSEEPSVQSLSPLPMFRQKQYLLLLFMTGLISLAMEVVWTRQFIPFLGPVVYTFASILVIYLAATLIGSQIYRVWFRNHPFLANSQGWQILASIAATAALFPLVAADFRLSVPSVPLFGLVRVIIGVGPFCAVLGFMTPALLDRVSSGNPKRAGYAFALNMAGCIIGPLLGGFLLLPLCGERWSLVLLALPLFCFGIFSAWKSAGASVGRMGPIYLRATVVILLFLSIVTVVVTKDYEKMYPMGVVLRDHTATVIAGKVGTEGVLLVNGVGMTKLTPITKMMVHLPLASLENPPQKGLVLCLGMGTSFRSMLSWHIPTTVVELVPSVPKLLPFFHSDGAKLLAAPEGHIVVDDARRFLERSKESFSVIVIDPPPPVEAAASSLLYSKELYAAASRRLALGGILQQWIPWDSDGFDETLLLVAMTKALSESFPYVRVFKSVEGWGLHFLASNRPIPLRTTRQLAALLPGKAAADLVEWGPRETPQGQFAEVLSQEVLVSDIIALSPGTRALSDDRPTNEYFLVRRLFR